MPLAALPLDSYRTDESYADRGIWSPGLTLSLSLSESISPHDFAVSLLRHHSLQCKKRLLMARLFNVALVVAVVSQLCASQQGQGGVVVVKDSGSSCQVSRCPACPRSGPPPRTESDAISIVLGGCFTVMLLWSAVLWQAGCLQCPRGPAKAKTTKTKVVQAPTTYDRNLEDPKFRAFQREEDHGACSD